MAFDIYGMVTDKIIAQMENGIIPWHKPWFGSPEGAFNRVSKKPYSLLNQMLLSRQGEYASFKQWGELGGKIKKGAKSETVVFWKIYVKETKDDDGEAKRSSYPILRYMNVFHIDDVEGVEPLKQEELKELNPIDDAERIVLEYIERNGIDIRRDEVSNRAFYSPLNDSIQVPALKQFAKAEEYYSTLFHEMTHSTGHSSRLNRFDNERKLARFGSEDYSKEELIAEIGSANLLTMLGINTESTFKNNVAYLQNWLQVLKNDNKFIVSASSAAQKATKYILGEYETEDLFA